MKAGENIHGWIALDKPEGMGSTQALGKVKRLFNAAKAGHGGTLDPLASGLLPIALGEATKTVSWVMGGLKTYRVLIRWGEARTTDDREGVVSSLSEHRPSRNDIDSILSSFEGEIWQTPPKYSAVKVQGERAYDLARAGEAVDLVPRVVFIEKIELLALPDADHAELSVICGKGTYIRSLARDLAQALGTVGYVARLRRTRVGLSAKRT